MGLDPKSFGLTSGIFWGGFLLVFTLISVNTGFGVEFLNLVVTLYPGYEISYVGSLIGLAYGFFDGLIGCYIFAWLYNKLEKKFSK